MSKQIQKLLSLILVLAMVTGMFPVTARATDTEEVTSEHIHIVEISEDGEVVSVKEATEDMVTVVVEDIP